MIRKIVTFASLLIFTAGAIAVFGQVAPQDLLKEAEHELFAARYQKAADLYSRALAEDPGRVDAHYGLVRALIEAHRADDAYAAAARGLEQNSNTPRTQSAAGLAAFRHGDLAEAEKYYQAALKLDANDVGALRGLASIYSALSKFASARVLTERAYRLRPDDPALMRLHADTLKGSEHIAALEKVLAGLDVGSDDARDLRGHIADDRALGDRKTRKLVSAYVPTQIKLLPIRNGSDRRQGLGLRVELNRRQSVTLLLDTGASGISVAPGVAKKAGLEMLGAESSDIKGIGDKPAADSFTYLAAEVRAGDVSFADYPIEVFRNAQSTSFDGIVGADVFRDFIVTLDFPRAEMTLSPRASYEPNESHEPSDASPSIPPGFYRAARFGNHLTIPTLINDKASKLFLIDSGADTNLIDTEVGRTATKVRGDDNAQLQGIQGNVKKISRADSIHLQFAGFRQDNPDLLAISLVKLGDSVGMAIGGVLGMPVLQHLKMTLDYRDGTVRFEYGR